jgi:hypothetical protein
MFTRTNLNVNDRITVFGLPFLLVLAGAIILVFTFIMSLMLGALMLLVFVIVVAYIAKEQKKGNQDVIASVMIYLESADVIEDGKDDRAYFEGLITTPWDERKRDY